MIVLLFAFLALLLIGFTIYKTIYPTSNNLGFKPSDDSMAIILPDKQNETQRPIQMWLPPCNSKLLGRCGPTLNCCGCYFPSTVF